MTETAAPKRSEEPEAHPVVAAIDAFVHRVRDTKQAVRQFMPLAQDARAKSLRDMKADLDRIGPLLKSSDKQIRVLAQRDFHPVMLRTLRARNARVAETLETGLYLTLFTAFDAFVGDLLRALYVRRAALFDGVERSVSYAELLEADSLESVRRSVIEEDIEALRRKSYKDQFAGLTARFKVELTRFPNWPHFIEAGQRRNLLAHCNGVVSAQYRKACLEVGLREDDVAPIGTRLRLGPKYFLPACELVLEVGFKLGQTLWRKTMPDELESADDHLRESLYSTLEYAQWQRARMMGEFGMTHAKGMSDMNRKIVTLNYVQALQRDGDTKAAYKILGEVDWSASALMFQIAVAALRKDYAAAAALMKRIGPNDTYLTEHSYLTFPVFLEFRDTEEFASAFHAVFGHAHSAALSDAAAAVGVEVGEAAIAQENIAASDQAEAQDEAVATPHTTGEEPSAESVR